MHELILWCGFAGAWLLVLGPVYQAVLELAEEDEAVDRVRARMADLPRPKRVSAFWWLLPPVAWWLRHRAGEQVRKALIDSLDAEELATLTRYVSAARGWIYVGLGGSLIAVKETWELVEHHEWPMWLFALLVLVMLLLALGNSVATARRLEQTKDRLAA